MPQAAGRVQPQIHGFLLLRLRKKAYRFLSVFHSILPLI